jgi:predicted Zn-dependent protease
MPMRRTVACVAAALSIAACDVSQESEVELGRQSAGEIAAQLPLVDDPVVERYITALGTSIARRADTRGLEWKFRVVDSRAVNAFALPGGFIFVNRGLIERSGSLSELAGVLGHEIGHVTLRHSVEQLKSAQKTNIGVTLLCVLTNVCESGLARVAINVGGNALFAKHSREDEREADSVAVLNVVRAGISPTGIPSMFETLMAERRSSPGVVDTWFGTHPLEESRVAETRRLVSALDPGMVAALTVDSPEFQAFHRRVRALPPPPPEPGAP